MALKVNISFKESERDMYDFLKSKLSPSVYLKEYIQSQMIKSEPVKKEEISNFDMDL